MYNKDVFKAVTDERLVIDVVAPGYGKDAVTVKTAKVNGGEAFKIVVEGKYVGHTNKAGDPIPRVAFEKYVEDFKYTFSDDTNFGDDLFRSSTFTSKDYDLDKLCYSVSNGVIRITVPKTQAAVGTVVKAVENADANSTGVPKTDAVTAAE
jgi:HSP20 family molecular chaperone IbpA